MTAPLVRMINPNRSPAKNNRVLTKLSLSVVVGIVLGVTVAACGNDQTAQPKNYPDKGTPQAQLYMEKCSQCHAAPLPSTHTGRMWPSVLQRMQMRMKTKNVQPLSRKEMSIILGYLQQHAKSSPDKP